MTKKGITIRNKSEAFQLTSIQKLLSTGNNTHSSVSVMKNSTEGKSKNIQTKCRNDQINQQSP